MIEFETYSRKPHKINRETHVWTALLYSMAKWLLKSPATLDVTAALATAEPARKLQTTVSFYFPTYHKIFLNIVMIITLLISQIQIRNSAIIRYQL
jgi:hypothetical protein